MDSESHVKIIKEDARMAKMSLQAREDMELVVDTLTEFRRDLDGEKREDDEAVPVLKDILFRMNNMPNVDDDALKVFRKEVSDALLKKEFLTEMTKGGPVEMTDATKIKLKLDVAKTLSKIKLNHFKLDSNSYIHYDELKIRIPRMLNLAGNLFEKLKEMVINKEENAVQRITEEWVMGLHDVWSDAKTGVHD